MFISNANAYWTIQSPSEVKALSPSIEFEWDKFTIQSKLKDKTNEVDTKHSMSYLQDRKLRKILKTHKLCSLFHSERLDNVVMCFDVTIHVFLVLLV